MNKKNHEFAGKKDFANVEKIEITGEVDIIIKQNKGEDPFAHVTMTRHKDYRGQVDFLNEDGILRVRSVRRSHTSSKNIQIGNSTGTQISVGDTNIQTMNPGEKKRGKKKSETLQICCADDQLIRSIVIDGNLIMPSLRPIIEISIPGEIELDFGNMVGKIGYK